MKLSLMPVRFDCGGAAFTMTRQELPLLVDMLKWPICGYSRDAVMLRIAELQNADPKDFGIFSETKGRFVFRTDIRSFIRWLERQNGPDGKPFNVADPAICNPYFPSRRSGANACGSATETNR
jgi:hypothetical protein